MTEEEKIKTLSILLVQLASGVIPLIGTNMYEEIVNKVREILGVENGR